jgi:hypothetical protein
MFVLLMPREEKDGASVSAEAWALAVSDGLPVDILARDENGTRTLLILVAGLSDACCEARNITDDGLGGMTRVVLFHRAAQTCRVRCTRPP